MAEVIVLLPPPQAEVLRDHKSVSEQFDELEATLKEIDPDEFTDGLSIGHGKALDTIRAAEARSQQFGGSSEHFATNYAENQKWLLDVDTYGRYMDAAMTDHADADQMEPQNQAEWQQFQQTLHLAYGDTTPANGFELFKEQMGRRLDLHNYLHGALVTADGSSQEVVPVITEIPSNTAEPVATAVAASPIERHRNHRGGRIAALGAAAVLLLAGARSKLEARDQRLATKRLQEADDPKAQRRNKVFIPLAVLGGLVATMLPVSAGITQYANDHPVELSAPATASPVPSGQPTQVGGNEHRNTNDNGTDKSERKASHQGHATKKSAAKTIMLTLKKPHGSYHDNPWDEYGHFYQKQTGKDYNHNPDFLHRLNRVLKDNDIKDPTKLRVGFPIVVEQISAE